MQIRGNKRNGEEHHGRWGMGDETKAHDVWCRLEIDMGVYAKRFESTELELESGREESIREGVQMREWATH